MHPAPAFLETDPSTLVARMKAWPFALICSVLEGRPVAAHAPVCIDSAESLRFHLARANPAWRALTQTGHALIVFSGAHDYISPDWYGIKDQVGTWNYLSVEADGPVETLDRDETVRCLDDLSDQFEAGLAPKPSWSRAKMEPGKFERMLGAITGFSMVPTRLEGITKIGQNKPAEVRQRAGAALKAAGGDAIISAMMGAPE